MRRNGKFPNVYDGNTTPREDDNSRRQNETVLAQSFLLYSYDDAYDRKEDFMLTNFYPSNSVFCKNIPLIPSPFFFFWKSCKKKILIGPTGHIPVVIKSKNIVQKACNSR